MLLAHLVFKDNKKKKDAPMIMLLQKQHIKYLKLSLLIIDVLKALKNWKVNCLIMLIGTIILEFMVLLIIKRQFNTDYNTPYKNCLKKC